MAMGAGFTLRELARALHATLEGDAAAVVIGVAPLESAGPDQISFLVDARYVEAAKASRAGAFLAGPEVSGLPAPVLRVPAPQQALIELLTLFHPPAEAVAGVAPSAVVARDASVAPTATVGALAVIESGAVIGPHVRIGPLAFVGAGAEVGEASVVHARVAVCARVRLGKRVVVHPGAVIGADGFGYAFDGEAHRKIPQVGSVVVEDDVEIGANATVDRATLGQTIIRRGTKIDNLVQIGHNVEIGEHSIIVAQVGISGSCRVGRGVVLAGQVGVADHLTIGDGAVVAAQSGLARDVAPGEKVFGTPARPLIEAKRIFVLEGELPELARRLRSAERRLAQLEARLGAGGA
ncbi:MAG: UDP-3-O-(3-hydroxymyristoyl)glucosamine N-acyltransferase [Candidatus Rokuibacteriota bacterium]|nr:MAG: UDP-3-O-(3-hydroxymyristoyl)glucosamine N-acyltransferase [Candidatus Rokubacteria bacterium]